MGLGDIWQEDVNTYIVSKNRQMQDNVFPLDRSATLSFNWFSTPHFSLLDVYEQIVNVKKHFEA